MTHDSQLIPIEGKLIDLFLGISQDGVKGKKRRNKREEKERRYRKKKTKKER